MEIAVREHEGLEKLYIETKEIWFSSERHSLSNATATGGGGRTVVYNNKTMQEFGRTLAHESGHNLETNNRGLIGKFTNAVKGEKPPTSYAMTNTTEDLAESCYMYFYERDRLLRTAPKRFDFLYGIFNQ